ncbi:MAG: hypothetical protein GWO02_04590 [Gammaproteobacteria bacterium]|nr:hypothetical protein [Gammaproteobacteria bacterium]
MGRPASQLVVRSHRPWIRWALALLIPAAVGGAAWLGFDYGQSRAGFDRADARARIHRLGARIEALEAGKERLSQRVVMLERAAEVDAEAYQEVKRTVGELQARLAEQRKELTFYRNIVSPATYSAGLHIESFGLAARGGARVFDYKLVLMQVAKNYRTAQGQVEMTIEGSGEDGLVALEMKDVDVEENGKRAYAFKYFQTLEGQLRLPEGFAPERVQVRVTPRGKREAALEQTYDWSEVIG